MMLGDWYVCYNDHQDLCYRQMTEKDFAIPDEKLTVHNYSPVELTEEILLKNGFFDAPNNIFLLAEIDDNGDKKISIKMKKGKYRIDITNDGLSFDDWLDWFKDYDLTKPMAIIHFTPMRY